MKGIRASLRPHALRLLIVLLAAVGLTVAVAWSAAIGLTYRENAERGTKYWYARRCGDGLVVGCFFGGSPSPGWSSAVWGAYRFPASMDPERREQQIAMVMECPPGNQLGDPPDWGPLGAALRCSVPPTVDGGLLAECGWPFRALGYTRTDHLDNTLEYGWALRPALLVDRRWLMPHRALPLRPLVVGLVLDVLFYGAGLWLLIAGGRWARGVVRGRFGRCRRCAYNLGGSPPGTRCPECGYVRAPRSMRG